MVKWRPWSFWGTKKANAVVAAGEVTGEPGEVTGEPGRQIRTPKKPLSEMKERDDLAIDTSQLASRYDLKALLKDKEAVIARFPDRVGWHTPDKREARRSFRQRIALQLVRLSRKKDEWERREKDCKAFAAADALLETLDANILEAEAAQSGGKRRKPADVLREPVMRIRKRARAIEDAEVTEEPADVLREPVARKRVRSEKPKKKRGAHKKPSDDSEEEKHSKPSKLPPDSEISDESDGSDGSDHSDGDHTLKNTIVSEIAEIAERLREPDLS